MESEAEFPLIPQEKDKKKLELQRKYKRVNGERVLFLDEWIGADSVEVGDKLVWQGSQVRRLEILDPNRRDEYYLVVERDTLDDGTQVYYGNKKLTGSHNFHDLSRD
jgi:hypothetical protein